MKAIVPVLILAAGGLATWWMLTGHSRPEPKAPLPEPALVDTVRVHVDEQAVPVYSQGVALPRTKAALVSEVSGRVMYVHASFVAGGFFDADDVLLRVDPANYDLAVTMARAAVAEARKELQRELAEVEQARHEWRALGGGRPSDYVMHVPQLAERRAKLAAAEAGLDEARLQRRRCDLRAPFAGRLQDKRVDVGQYVTTGEALANVYATDYAEVRLPIANEQLALLDLPLAYRDGPVAGPGPAVRIRARIGEQMHEWPARIVRTEGLLDPQSGMLHAVARVDDPYRYHANRPPLLAGLFVQAEIEGRKRADLVRLPVRALHRGASRVMVVDDKQRLQFREVTVLRRERDEVYLTHGLTPGERVIVGGLDVPVEGMRVRYEDDVAPASMSAQRP